jgi:hypothetical protein
MMRWNSRIIIATARAERGRRRHPPRNYPWQWPQNVICEHHIIRLDVYTNWRIQSRRRVNEMNAETRDRAARCRRDLKFWCWASRYTAEEYIAACNGRRDFVRELPRDAKTVFPALGGAHPTRQVINEAERISDFPYYADEHYMLIPDDIDAREEPVAGYRVLRGKPAKLSNVEHMLVEIDALNSVVSKALERDA